jgi:drug/metabolite transporter (DMT)-like permease
VAETARILAISLAALGAIAMSFGAQFQNDAVGLQQKIHRQKSTIRSALNLRQLMSVMKRPRWLAGTILLGGATLLQLTALGLAPLIVVQPVGVIALVVTSVLNARMTKSKLNRGTLLAISACTLGIAGFVVSASLAATEPQIDDNKLRQVLAVLVLILIVFGLAFLRYGKRFNALTYIVGTGVLYGFVATLTKVVIQRIYQGQFEWLTLLCLALLGVAVALGGWFVQNAYSSGPPDLVIAGLTVIDPMIAVLIAAIVLGEAKTANVLTVIIFLVCAIAAILGVLLLSQFHPQVLLAKRKAALWSRRKRF